MHPPSLSNKGREINLCLAWHLGFSEEPTIGVVSTFRPYKAQLTNPSDLRAPLLRGRAQRGTVESACDCKSTTSFAPTTRPASFKDGHLPYRVCHMSSSLGDQRKFVRDKGLL